MKIFGFKFGEDYQFTISVTNPVAAIFKARQAVQSNGGTLSGTATGGTFSGRGVEGNYSAQLGAPNVFNVTITRKPWLVSNSYVEQKVREYFQGT